MLEGLEVDVARLVADRLPDDEIDEPDDRRLFGHRLDIPLGEIAAVRREVARADLLQQVVDAGLVLPVVLLDLHIDLVGIGEEQPNVTAERKRQIVDGLRVEGIADEEVDVLAVGAERHHAVVARELAGQRRDGLARKLHGQLREIIVAEVFRDPVEQHGFLDDAEIDHDVGQRFAGGFVLLVELVELRRIDEPVVFQELEDGGAVAGKHQAGRRFGGAGGIKPRGASRPS